MPPTRQRGKEGDELGGKEEMSQEMIIIVTIGTRIAGGEVVISIRVSQKKAVKRKRAAFQAISRGKFDSFSNLLVLLHSYSQFIENLP